MVNATVKMHNLQELIRKVHLDGLLNEAVIMFKDNRMKIEAIGKEIENDVIDQAITIDVNYPCESVKETGEVALKEIGDFLGKLELFERDDIVEVSTLNNKVYVTRNTPYQSLDFDLADKKFVKTYSEGLKTIFGSPIKLVMGDREKLIAFDTIIVVDSQKLKEHASKLEKFKSKTVPISVANGKLSASVRGEISGFNRDVEGVVSIVGSASSVYEKDILTVMKKGIGVTTLRFSEGSPMHIHYEHEGMSADYLVQIFEERT